MLRFSRKDMEEQRLKPIEIETIAQQSTGWKCKVSQEETYVSRFEGFDLCMGFTAEKAPSGGFPNGDQGDPYRHISFDIEIDGYNIGHTKYTNNPLSEYSKNKYLEGVLSRARTESSRERHERIDSALRRARDLVFKAQDI